MIDFHISLELLASILRSWKHCITGSQALGTIQCPATQVHVLLKLESTVECGSYKLKSQLVPRCALSHLSFLAKVGHHNPQWSKHQQQRLGESCTRLGGWTTLNIAHEPSTIANNEPNNSSCLAASASRSAWAFLSASSFSCRCISSWCSRSSRSASFFRSSSCFCLTFCSSWRLLTALGLLRKHPLRFTCLAFSGPSFHRQVAWNCSSNFLFLDMTRSSSSFSFSWIQPWKDLELGVIFQQIMIRNRSLLGKPSNFRKQSPIRQPH